MMWLTISEALAAPVASCKRKYDSSELSSAVDAVERAFTNMDGAGLKTAEVDVQTRLVCVGEPLAPELIARVHRAEALAAYVAGEQAHVPAALVGVLLADPGHDIPTSLVPEEHPLREQRRYATKLMKEGLPRPLLKPESGWFEVDGDPNHTPLTTGAAIVQRLDGQGQVTETRYLWPETELGDWARPEVVATSTESTASKSRAVPRATLGFAAVAGGPSESASAKTPGAFGGVGPGLGVGVSVPIVGRLSIAGDLGFQAMARNDSSIDMQSFRLWAGPALRIGTAFALEGGPSFAWATMTAPEDDLAGRGLLGGLALDFSWRFAKLGPVGLGARLDVAWLGGGDQGLGWIGLGLGAAWEGE